MAAGCMLSRTESLKREIQPTMSEVGFRNHRAVQMENEKVRVTVLVEGGHIAEILDKATGVSPLWIPPWPSIEPSTYDRSKHTEYGDDAESKLLAGIMGHNLCLDLFGSPSPEEAAAGMTVHGEASIAPYAITSGTDHLTATAAMPIAQLRIERTLRLAPGSVVVRIHETVENLSALDRPAAWTQHVTLGPPFLEKGRTQFRAPGTRSISTTGQEFDWPNLPKPDGHSEDLRVYTSAPASGGFTTHLMDPHRDQAFFLAFSPSTKLLAGYVWKRTDFPWLGIWEENCSNCNPPWNGRTLTRGMEFCASPFPESRRKMIDRNSLFGVPTYRWIPARTRVSVDYCAFLATVEKIPDNVVWDGVTGLKFE